MEIERTQPLLQSLKSPVERNSNNRYRFKDSLSDITHNEKDTEPPTQPSYSTAAVPMAGWLNELRAQKEKAANLQSQRRKEQKEK